MLGSSRSVQCLAVVTLDRDALPTRDRSDPLAAALDAASAAGGYELWQKTRLITLDQS
jgi:hypothetical protein